MFAKYSLQRGMRDHKLPKSIVKELEADSIRCLLTCDLDCTWSLPSGFLLLCMIVLRSVNALKTREVTARTREGSGLSRASFISVYAVGHGPRSSTMEHLLSRVSEPGGRNTKNAPPKVIASTLLILRRLSYKNRADPGREMYHTNFVKHVKLK